MDGEVKDFPASEHKLDQLRKAGIFPLSVNVISFGSILGLILVVPSLYFLLLTPLAALCTEAFKSDFVLTGKPEIVFQAGKFLLLSLLGIIALVLFPVVVIGLLQSRFYFSSVGLKMPIKTLKGSFASGLGLPAKFLANGLSLALILAFWCIFCVLVFKNLQSSFDLEDKQTGKFSVGTSLSDGTKVSESRNSSLNLEANRVFKFLSANSLLFLLFSFTIAIISLLLVVISFKREHRMSRREVEEELKEFDNSRSVFARTRIELE